MASHRYQVAPPTKEGQLLKYRNFWNGWSMRYFKLDKCYLHYFEAKHAPEPIDSLPRNCIVAAKASDGFTDRNHVFEIQQKSGTVWYAQAESMEEMIEWLRVLSPIPVMVNPKMYPTTTNIEARHVARLQQSHGIPHAPATNEIDQIYPSLPQDLYHQYHGNVGTSHEMPPPPYSEIVNGNR